MIGTASAAEQDSTQETFALQATGTESSVALRQTVAERLARHRSRRAVGAHAETQHQAPRREEVRNVAREGASRVREAVAARYEQRESYREYLAAEADRALQRAQAEAEIAARNAHAVAAAQMELLRELEQWNNPKLSPREQALEQSRAETRSELAHALADIALGARELIQEPAGDSIRDDSTWDDSVLKASIREDSRWEGSVDAASAQDCRQASLESASERPLNEVSAGGLTVKLFGRLESVKPIVEDLKPNRYEVTNGIGTEPGELHHLEEELERRHAMEAPGPHTLETTAIPANLIEFPRQLVAPRRVRPRLAEGPLREEAAPAPQLRIFEVEAEQVATVPPPAEPTAAPGWQELLLESTRLPAHVPPVESQMEFTLQPEVAPVCKRLFAAGVDGACLLGALTCFAEVALHLGGAGLRLAPRPLLAGAAAVALLGFFTLYQMLFFSLNEATPGMRAARIALCTFGDDNPSRPAMRRRVLATWLAACPLGVGLFWSFLDDEHLGWHDRMSRMYQRAY